MTSVYIVGNCHVYAMQRSVKFFDSALFVEGCHLWEVKRRFADAQAFLAHTSGFDHVLTLSFDEEVLPGLTSSIMTEQLAQTTLYPTVTFGAFHPDVVYCSRNDGGRDLLSSPLGPFHSSLVLYGYLRGYDAARTMASFNGASFERLGFLSAWDVAMDEIVRRPEARSFDMGRMAKGWLRHGCFMHNPQHPKAAPVHEIARVAMDRMGLTARHGLGASYLPDDLLVGPIWPVYPEIASYYGLPGSYTFKRDTGPSRWPEFMTLEEFVLASYECYSWHDMTAYGCERVNGWLATGVEP